MSKESFYEEIAKIVQNSKSKEEVAFNILKHLEQNFYVAHIESQYYISPSDDFVDRDTELLLKEKLISQ